jgi:hypothetical protein
MLGSGKRILCILLMRHLNGEHFKPLFKDWTGTKVPFSRPSNEFFKDAVLETLISYAFERMLDMR